MHNHITTLIELAKAARNLPKPTSGSDKRIAPIRELQQQLNSTKKGN